MTEQRTRARFLDLFEGRLSEKDAKAIRDAIESSETLRMEYRDFETIAGGLDSIGKEDPEIPPTLTDEICRSVRLAGSRPFLSNLLRAFEKRTLIPVLSFATICCLALFLYSLVGPPSAVHQQFSSVASVDLYEPPSRSIGSTSHLGNYNDTRTAEFTNRVFGYVDGSAGAIALVVFALAAITLACFRRYRWSPCFLILAVLTFLLRMLVATFFNDVAIM